MITPEQLDEAQRVEDDQREAFALYEAKRTVRNAYFAELVKQGATYQQLATATGLSRARLHGIVKDSRTVQDP
jgi:uncharacterized protein YerC